MIYEATNESVLESIPRTSRRLLDLGCGTGSLGLRLKTERSCYVAGVTYSEAEAKSARDRLDDVRVMDLAQFRSQDLGRFDCVICSHILEHLQHPEELLRKLHNSLTDGGELIVALPNSLHWRQRLHFLRGEFRYTEGGLMDRTHLRFFDWSTARELIESTGYRIIEMRADGTFPASRLLGRLARPVDALAVSQLPGLFGFQFLIRAKRAEGAS